MHRPSSPPSGSLPRRAASCAALALGLLVAGCVKSSSHDHGPPIYSESENNDTAARADDFGVLRPGDFFVIRGDVSDRFCDPFDPYEYCDPFDGFRFTSGEAIYVEFRLFMDRAGHDFDVCLYDPQLDLTLDCWQSPYDPEVGAVEVFAGGLDFHLVVESFLGTGGYEMEIEVFGLYESGLSAPEAGGALPQQLIAKREGVGGQARPEAARAGRGYSGEAEAEASSDEESRTLEVDPATGAVEEQRRVEEPDAGTH